MRSSFITITLLTLLNHAIVYGREPIWGEAVNGLRVGLSLEPASSTAEPTLRISFQNTGAAVKEIIMGDSGTVPYYSLFFVATDPAGHSCEVLNGNALDSLVPGYVSPIVVRLLPGAQHHIRMPTKKLLCVENRTDITLDALFEREYGLRVLFKADRERTGRERAVKGWSGQVRSAELSRKDLQ